MKSVLAGIIGGFLAANSFSNRPRASRDVAAATPSAPSRNRATTGQCRSGLPEFTREEVASHNSFRKGVAEPRVFVTYKCGVYDVTDFITQHPGGVKRILLAAGGDIERFWKQYTIHDDDAVRDMLEKHRVGNVKGYVAAPTQGGNDADADAPWRNEPARGTSLKVLNLRPFNAETPEGVLDEYFTPNDMFFVRNHMPVPLIHPEPGSFCLKVDGEGLLPRCFSVKDLREKFAHHTVVNTIQCGGNRRTEMAERYAAAPHDAESGVGGFGAVKGLAWTNGAIGTAAWKGVRLKDVIQACQVAPVPEPHRHHVLMEGADKDDAGHFNVSVPYELVMDPKQECLVAFEMNGEPIPRDHGFPLRAIIPGTVGVRNCKWLQRVTVQPQESQSTWQQQDYKNFPSYLQKPDERLPSVYGMPVQSAITDATYDANADEVVVRGYAYSGSGTGIQRVEATFDGGQTFERSAELLPLPPEVLQGGGPSTARRSWAWRQVELRVAAGEILAKPQTDKEGKSYYRTCLRAVADDQSTQPPVAQYNFRGLLYNGYSCRDVSLV